MEDVIRWVMLLEVLDSYCWAAQAKNGAVLERMAREDRMQKAVVVVRGRLRVVARGLRGVLGFGIVIWRFLY